MQSYIVRSHFALLLAMVIWGSSFIALKFAVTEIAPLVVVFLRMSVGATAFLMAWLWVPKNIRYRAGDWVFLLGMALFEPCLYFIFESYALVYTSAGQAGLVTAMLPLMVAVTAFLFLGERNSVQQWLGFLVAVAGVIWMSLSAENTDQAPNALLGNSLEFLAMVCAVGYTLLVKHLSSRYSAFVLTALQCFIGTIFFLPLALLSPWPGEISSASTFAIIYLGLVVSLGAYGLFNFSLSQLPASTAAGYTNLVPAFALIFSMLLLQERLVLSQWLAIGIIFIGVLLSQTGATRTHQVNPPSVTG